MHCVRHSTAIDTIIVQLDCYCVCLNIFHSELLTLSCNASAEFAIEVDTSSSSTHDLRNRLLFFSPNVAFRCDVNIIPARNRCNLIVSIFILLVSSEQRVSMSLCVRVCVYARARAQCVHFYLTFLSYCRARTIQPFFRSCVINVCGAAKKHAFLTDMLRCYSKWNFLLSHCISVSCGQCGERVKMSEKNHFKISRIK